MAELKINSCENGWIVAPGEICRDLQWYSVARSADELADFIKAWAKKQGKPTKQKREEEG